MKIKVITVLRGPERKKTKMYKAYITKIKDIRPIPKADRINVGYCFGNPVIISKDYNETDLYIYFPVDGQLSEEFCRINDLVRRKDENGNPAGGYLDPDKRNVKALKLRGERSDGLVMPLAALEPFGDITELKEGDTIDVFNGVEICKKYIPRRQYAAAHQSGGNHTRKVKIDYAPLFAEHADTEQLAYNLGNFRPNDEVEITLKMHGTSGRTGYLPVYKKHKRSLLDRILRRPGTPIYEYDYVSGTRRVVLENYDGGFYGSNKFREQWHDVFKGKLQKGETVYYEIVGFTETGAPIMGNCSNEKVGKDFVKQYGKETIFSYGCEPGEISEDMCGMKPGQSDIYVYRMTITNEEGFTVEYSPDFMRYRCEQMGIKCVPAFIKLFLNEESRFYINNEDMTKGDLGEYIKIVAEQFYDGPDPIGKTHVREGVVVRILNRPKFTAFKHKNHDFKILSGIAVEQALESGATETMTDDILSEM